MLQTLQRQPKPSQPPIIHLMFELKFCVKSILLLMLVMVVVVMLIVSVLWYGMDTVSGPIHSSRLEFAGIPFYILKSSKHHLNITTSSSSSDQAVESAATTAIPISQPIRSVQSRPDRQQQREQPKI